MQVPSMLNTAELHMIVAMDATGCRLSSKINGFPEEGEGFIQIVRYVVLVVCVCSAKAINNMVSAAVGSWG